MNNELVNILQIALNEYVVKTLSGGIASVLGSGYWDICNDLLNDPSTRAECKVTVNDDIHHLDLFRLFYLLIPPEGTRNIWSQMAGAYPELNHNQITAIRNLKGELENSDPKTAASFTYARVKRELNNIGSALAPIDNLIFQKMSPLFNTLEKTSPIDGDSKALVDLSEDRPYYCEQIKREVGKIVLDDQGEPIVETVEVDRQELKRFFEIFQYETVENDVYIIDQEEMDNIYRYSQYYTPILDQIDDLATAEISEIPLLAERIRSMVLASDFSYCVLEHCEKILRDVYLKGAQGEDLYCICQIAHDYYRGRTINGKPDYEKAALWAQEALKIEPEFSAYLSEIFYYNTVTLLGLMYARGDGGIVQNDVKAKECFKLAADHGDLQGIADYFIMCCEEINRSTNTEMLNELEQEVSESFGNVISVLESYPDEFYTPNAYDFYNPYHVCVKTLLSEVYFVYGRMLVRSKKSAKKDVLLGIENLKKAAVLNNSKSMNLLGELYAYYLPKKNQKEAFHWFDLGYQEDPDYEDNTILLALCYNEGRGVIRNIDQANSLLKPLIARENQDAIMISENGFKKFDEMKNEKIKSAVKSLKKSMKRGDDTDCMFFMCLLPPIGIYKMWKYELFDYEMRKGYTAIGVVYSLVLSILFIIGMILLGSLFLKIVFVGAIFSVPVYYFLNEVGQLEEEQIE